MPKTYSGLYPQIYDFETLYKAYLSARKGKRYARDCLEFTTNLEENLIDIQNHLIYKTYQCGRYREFYVYEPKKRLIMAPPFRDRIVHHAICSVVEPLFEQAYIYDSYACRVGKGTHAGADRVTEFLRKAHKNWGKVYVLKADVSKYFPSINHDVLRQLLRKRIRCRDTLWLMDTIIASAADSDDPDPVGIPIGNLTSQMFANIYLNELDHFAKEVLCIKYYVRYMDDFIVLHHSKACLWQWRREIEEFLDCRLRLKLNRKTGIFPASQGIDFLGYRIWKTHRLLRKSSIKRARRGFKKLAREYADGSIPVERVRASVVSWIGHAEHADTYRLRKKLLGELVLRRGR